MADWKQEDNIICTCGNCGEKMVIKTENKITVSRPSLKAKVDGTTIKPER
jgi:hypothetical protein